MRFLIVALTVFIILVLLLSFVRTLLAPSSPQRHDRATGSSGGRLVKDPICGAYVPQNTAVRAENEFFCSEECRQTFLLKRN